MNRKDIIEICEDQLLRIHPMMGTVIDMTFSSEELTDWARFGYQLTDQEFWARNVTLALLFLEFYNAKRN
jgi:hypothetical protein